MNGFRGRMMPYLAVGGLIVVGLLATGALATEAGIRWLLVGGLILLVGARPWFLAASTAFVLVLATFVLQPPVDFRARSFFGVTEVLTSSSGDLKLLMNGTTVHGSQSTDPARSREPQSYYVRNGPAGDLVALAKAQAGAEPLDIGVIGLGAGGMAAYVEPGTAMTFFEIDPVVVRVANDPAYFSYLSGAPVKPAIVLGDARLSLAAEPASRFDLVVLDAFSSDSPPVHLLDGRGDRRRDTHDQAGRHRRVPCLEPLLRPRAARRGGCPRTGLTVLEKWHAVGPVHEPGETPSHWLAASRDPAAIASLRASGWADATARRPSVHRRLRRPHPVSPPGQLNAARDRQRRTERVEARGGRSGPSAACRGPPIAAVAGCLVSIWFGLSTLAVTLPDVFDAFPAAPYALDGSRHLAVASAVAAGGDPYTVPGYLYPPPGALVMLPLTALGAQGGLWAWFAIKVGITLWCVLDATRGRPALVRLLAIVFVATLLGVMDDLWLGNVSILMAASIYLAVSRDSPWSAVPLGLVMAALAKPFLVPFLSGWSSIAEPAPSWRSGRPLR